ncbi:orotate phosphoribosyltransferase [Synechocystis sp. LKSZ1]|uniref:orotate phosphoribosyltransferase n=1 Tax=Synechocystis sp. LKSZ1 TaxID=3144951 RepID=UPI00336C0081
MQSLNLANVVTAPLDELRSGLRQLITQLAYQEGNFTLSSGQSSSYYINGKKVTLTAEGGLMLGRLILALLPADTQAVAGLTLGADPLVSAVSIVSAYEQQPIPALIVRKEAKGHGTKAYIEGPDLATGAKVVVLEDVVTTGKSALLAVERLRGAGYVVEEILAMVDREQGGAEFYQGQGLRFQALFKISDIQEQARQNQSF